MTLKLFSIFPSDFKQAFEYSLVIYISHSILTLLHSFRSFIQIIYRVLQQEVTTHFFILHTSNNSSVDNPVCFNHLMHSSQYFPIQHRIARYDMIRRASILLLRSHTWYYVKLFSLSHKVEQSDCLALLVVPIL